MIYFEVMMPAFTLKEKLKLKKWLKALAISEGFNLKELSYVFMSDDDLLKMNIEYLNHQTFTDIITFDNSEKEKDIVGDIFISIDRVKENAVKFKVTFEQELHRVMAHGVLHLCGYKDKKEAEVKVMREKENYYLQTYEQF